MEKIGDKGGDLQGVLLTACADIGFENARAKRK